jgi:hypothetical protein
MPESKPAWKVLSHGPVEALAENLWNIRGELPHLAIGRQMTVARSEEGRLLLHSPMALAEPEMEHLESLGEIGVLYVPNGIHRMDCRQYQLRYPDARLLCPMGARAAVEKVATVDGTIEDLGAMTGVSLQELAGTGRAEGVLRVHSREGDTLVFNDTFLNVPHQPGLGGWLLRVMGSTGGPRVSWLARRLVVKDAGALRAAFESLAADSRIVRLIPGHGDRIEENVGTVLRSLAESL